jgi:aryl-alcohol dehydrogenase-like predicted oxidoreductase
VKIVSVQNLYNLSNRKASNVVDYCAQHGLGFIPWFPLAAGEISKPGGHLDKLSKQHGATVTQIALAWLLQRSPNILPIPGTSSIPHLEENVGAASVKLSEAEWEEISSSK